MTTTTTTTTTTNTTTTTTTTTTELTNRIVEAGTKTKFYAVIQLGYYTFGVGNSEESAKADATEWSDEVVFEEIDGLSVQTSSSGYNDGDLVLLECSKLFHDLVKRNRVSVGYYELDGILYANPEVDEYGELIELI